MNVMQTLKGLYCSRSYAIFAVAIHVIINIVRCRYFTTRADDE